MRAARLVVLAALATLAGACGPTTVHRPLELYVGGLSGRAQALVVLLFPGEAAPDCATIDLEAVQALDAPHRAEWRRDDADARGVTLPEVDDDRVTIVAFSEDASGAAIQVACRALEYADLESPDVSIQLSARPR